ncbi:MAG: hypothetical protein Q8L34_00165, partial [Candidatus Woesearchaeota archaeon]|nr:hypothetical protein [Candidatus Woesearchaeota archaeon]
MLEKRHWLLGLLVVFFVYNSLSSVSASHFAITDATFTSVNGTSFVVSDTVLSIPITFNITNLTAIEGDSADDADIVNITVAVIGNSNQQIVLGFNDTSPLVAVDGGDVGNTTFMVEVVLNFSFANLNASVLSTTANTLNITFEVWNLTGDGNINESVSDTDQSFTFYVSGPLVTIKFLDTNNNEKTTFGATDKVKIVCTRSSAYTGISFNDTNVSIQLPGQSTFDSLDSSTTRAAVATDFTVEFTNTRELGDYTIACFARDDNAFLNDTANSTFTIVKKPPRGSSPFVNPDFKPPVATILVTAGSVSSLGALTEEGSSRLIMKGGAVSVTVAGTDYTLTLKDLTDTSAT